MRKNKLANRTINRKNGINNWRKTMREIYSRVWIEVIGNIHDNPELLEGATSNEAINPAKI